MNQLGENLRTIISYAYDGQGNTNMGLPEGALIRKIDWIVDSAGTINPSYLTGQISCGSSDVWIPLIIGREGTFHTIYLNKWCPSDLEIWNWGSFGYGGTPNVTAYVTYTVNTTTTDKSIEQHLQDIHFDAIWGLWLVAFICAWVWFERYYKT